MDLPTTLSPMDLQEAIQTNNERLDDVQYHQHTLEASLAASNQIIHDKLDKQPQRQDSLESKIDGLDKKMANRFDRFESGLDKKMEDRFDRFESIMNTRLAARSVPVESDLHSAGNSSTPLVPPGFESAPVNTTQPVHVSLPTPTHHIIPTLPTATLNTPPPPPFPPPNIQIQSNPTPTPAHFDGTDPLEWIFQSEQFFTYYNISYENRLPLAGFYMKGEALGWYKWMFQNNQLSDWNSFSRDLELRFGPSTYENHQAQLFKLRQHGSVAEYQAQFEKISNRVLGLPPDDMLNCFISGLNAEIRSELAIQRHPTISQAIGLAKLIESKIRDSKPKFSKPFTSPPNHPTTTSHATPKQLPNPPLQYTHNNTPQTTSLNPNPPSKLPIRRISNVQRDERRAQGLCFHCDEKFVPGHKCKTPKFLLLVVDDEEYVDIEEPPPEPEVEATTEPNETFFQLSRQALTRQLSPQSLKFPSLLHGLVVTVLVDTGSTHNILQPRIASHLHIPTKTIPNFSVMVGNGSHLNCSGFCPNVPINIQNNLFHIPFYLLPIEGADVVLGMEWL
ncbi:unnamed protein product [Trifolium pratense]|uniref:Uncharacterized protein n=1 Tax=Trifolium pratense TaxID=57577 RepID=A0ACB0MAQ0_TRIPR|nr:unnamed protein product [Trifolium pratense]